MINVYKKTTVNPGIEEAGTIKGKVTETLSSQKELTTLCSVIIFVSRCDQIIMMHHQENAPILQLFLKSFRFRLSFVVVVVVLFEDLLLLFLITNEDFVFCLGCVLSI